MNEYFSIGVFLLGDETKERIPGISLCALSLQRFSLSLHEEKEIQKLEMSNVKLFEQAGQPNIHHTVLYSKSQKPFSNKNYVLPTWFLTQDGM